MPTIQAVPASLPPIRAAGGLIRALTVSLAAVTAVIVSVTIARNRGGPRETKPTSPPEGMTAASRRNLDAIRRAGL